MPSVAKVYPILCELLARGHKVTAVARNLDKVQKNDKSH